MREKAEAAGTVVREQAEKAERAALEQAEKAEQAEKELARGVTGGWDVVSPGQGG